MRIYLILFALFSFFISYCQVNPNHHKVNGYYRSDGTYVKSHYRTNRNNTNRDNYSTKPNTNPWTDEKGYIIPDTKINYPSGTNDTTVNNRFKKPISTYYPTTGNSKTIMVAKLRIKPNPVAEIVIRIPVNAKIQIIKKENGYCKVKYGNWIGYLNEMYISSSKKPSFDYSKEKSISTHYPTTGNSKTIMVAKLRTKPNPVAEIVVRIPENAKIQIITKENGYYKVKYGNWIGYLNEMYISPNKKSFIDYSKEKPISTYYPKTGNSKTIMVAKLRTKPNPVAEIVVRIPENAKIQIIRKENGYYKVKYGNWTGYLNEMYISSNKKPSFDYSKEKPISTHYPATGNSKTIMVAKLRTKPNPVAEIIVRIPENVKIQIIKKENGYYKVKYGNWTGYLNEMYIIKN
ncbi:SH3 domain-containing protein [Olleya sp. HaHaR_3_96]|uniref:SH3 domain-containing protein n=1 Tax=Olleya sp. HaHaR_3_96 TaxID=2745560 RepID=UPI001C4F2F7C|nr:SH3 domain-containing protein [Olleya sp. HaHaR_3_96]QXP58456.1 SH3 domain-containing protein [Olleya sp. HaHaR_3_96]